jgi:glycosyltransferase involved in cell wall biosynthesis
LKKVLLITYHFPPRPTVGSLRPLGLAKYLPEFGWEVIILTARLPGRPAPGFRVIETPYNDALGFLRRFLGLDSEQNLMAQIAQLKKKLHIRSEKSVLDVILAAWGEVTAYPDTQKGWKAFAIRAGNDFLRKESVDAMISTSSPVTSHIIARELHKKHGIPWVADFRDLWTQNHYYPYSPIRRAIERRLELNTLREADALVTVSPPWAEKLRTLHRGKATYAITNGFDPDEVNCPEVNLTSKFTITYTGNFYPGKQSVEPLFAVLGNLIEQRIMNADDIEVRFYGAEVGWIDKHAEFYGLTKIVRQFGIIPRELALNKQRDSQLLLFIKWNDLKERGFYSAKIFEYMAAKRPILAIGGFDDVVKVLLDETKAGNYASTMEELKGILRELYQEYQESGNARYKGDKASINKYSHREMAHKFAEVLDEVSR